MNTPSHLLLTAALRRALGWAPRERAAVLLGAIAPDILLYVLSAGAFAYYRLGRGWDGERTLRYVYDRLFFEDPVWIVSHNLLHAPLILLAGFAVIHMLGGPTTRVRRWLFWFLVACAFHSAIDILTHHDDGPLLLFPFDWHLRFSSPVSYWDPAHFGREFSRFELGLDVALAVYLAVGSVRRWWARRPA